MTKYNEHSDVKSKFKEYDARLKAVERNQFGGATKDEVAEIRTLAAPTNFIVTSDSFLDETGTSFGRIQARWDPVTAVVDVEFSDVPQDIAQYELWGRPAGADGVWRRLTASPETYGEFSPLPPGENWHFRVRAISKTTSAPGLYSTEASLLIQGDTEAPPVPSAPITSSLRGSIIVEWNGFPSMPSDFRHIEIAVGASPEPTAIYGRLTGKGTVALVDQPYHQDRYIRFRSVDRSGNMSEWSPQVVDQALPFVDADLIGTTIDTRFQEAKNKASELEGTLNGFESTVSEAAQNAANAQTLADQAAESALAALTTASQKAQTYLGTIPPESAQVGDIFINTSTRETFVWDGDSWEATSSPVDVDAIVSDLVDNQDFMDMVSEQLDGVITTYYGPQPESAHEGDLWLDTTDPTNYILKRYNGSSWDVFDNPRVQAAYEAAQNAAPKDWILSRGTDLITNGTGYMGDNTNFSRFDYDGLDVPVGARGSFDFVRDRNAVLSTDEIVPVDPSRQYLLRYKLKQKNPDITTSRVYGFVQPVDVSGNTVAPTNYMYRPGTTTRLVRPLRQGDTEVHLEDATHWYNGSTAVFRRLIFWNYVDEQGRVWPKETYSRWTSMNVYGAGGANNQTGVITLLAPWEGQEFEAGHPVSNGGSGGTYIYIGANNINMPTEWTEYSGLLRGGTLDTTAGRAPGSDPVAASGGSGLPYGTAGVKVGFLGNYNNVTGSHQSFASISFSDTTAAQRTADTKVRTFAQSSTPTGMSSGDSGDLWINTGDKNKLYRWSGSAWEEVRDKTIEEALGVANSKGRVIFSATEPTSAEDRQPQNMWIDTALRTDPNGGPEIAKNTPHRWDGTAWVAITDASIVAAAKEAADAKKRADDAHTAIGTISENVEALQTSVSGKNSIGWGLTAPAGTGSQSGDIYYQYKVEDGSTRILGMWEWSGSEWSKREIDETYLPQVNIGTGTYGELDGIRLKAKSVHASDALVIGSIDDPVLIADGTVTAPKMVVDDTLWARLAEFVKVRAGMLEANSIDGMTITGAVLRTGESGQRVQIDPVDGINIYNSNGVPVLSGDVAGNLVLGGDASLDGNLSLSGTITADGPNYRMLMSNRGLELISKQSLTVEDNFPRVGQDWAHTIRVVGAYPYFYILTQNSDYTTSTIRVYNITAGSDPKVEYSKSFTPPSDEEYLDIRVKKGDPGSIYIYTAKKPSVPGEREIPWIKVLRVSNGTTLRTIPLPPAFSAFRTKVANWTLSPSLNGSSMYFMVSTDTWDDEHPMRGYTDIYRLNYDGVVQFTSRFVNSYVVSITAMAATDDRVYASIGDLLIEYRTDGTISRQIGVSGHIDGLEVIDQDILAISTGGEILGFPLSTNKPSFSWRILGEDYVSDFAYAANFLVVSGRGPYGATVYSVLNKFAPRAALDTASGRLTANGATLGGITDATEIQVQRLRAGDSADPIGISLRSVGRTYLQGTTSISGDLTVENPSVFNESITANKSLTAQGPIKDLTVFDPITVTGGNVNVIGATSWAHMTGGVLFTTLTLPAAAWVTISGSGVFSIPNNCDLRVGIDVTGATSVGHSEPNWGLTAWMLNLSGNSLTKASQFSKTVRLNAGTNTIRMMAYIARATQGNFNYPTIQVKFDKWAN